jgi:hypothetical protein
MSSAVARACCRIGGITLNALSRKASRFPLLLAEIELRDGGSRPHDLVTDMGGAGSTSQPARLTRAALLYHLPADFFESQFVSIQAE